MPFNYHTNATFYPLSPVDDDRGYGCNGSLGIAAGLGALALLNSRNVGLDGLFPSSSNKLELLNQKAKEHELLKVNKITKDTADMLCDHLKNAFDDAFNVSQPTERKQEDMNDYIGLNGDKLPNTGFEDFDDLWWYAYVAWSSDNNFGFGDYRTSVVLSKNIAFNKEQYNCDGDIGFYIKLKTIFKTQTFKPKENDRSKLHSIIALQHDIEEFNKKYPSKIHDKLLFQFLLDITTDNEYGIFPEVDPEKVKNIVDSIINS